MPSRERGVHRGGGLLPHPRHDARVAVHRESDAAVAEKFLHPLRVREGSDDTTQDHDAVQLKLQ
jgi:hypothetical protein